MSTPIDDYRTYDAVGLAELVRTRQVTPAELLAAARARAADVNPRINAIVADVDPATTRRSDGAPDDGPFAGVPFLVKDLHQDIAGHPTTGGSRSLTDLPAAENATVVQRWLDSGLVVFGKTNTPEFGAKGITEPELYGATRNPWDTDRSPGGSSGGSAAAVAAGIVPCAGASDGGGSIRIPASACGLFGLKTSRGLLPHGPSHGEPLGGTATDGVISRSVRDSAAMLDQLIGATDVSPYLPAVPESLADEVGRDPGRLRIGFCATSHINPDPDPEAVAAVTDAAALLAELGHEVVELAEPPVDDAALAKDFLTSWFVYCAHSVEEAKRASGRGVAAFEADTLLMAALGRATSSVDLVRAIENRHLHVRRLAEFHRTHDLLLTPTTATPPPRIGAFDPPAALRIAQAGLLKVRAAGLLRLTPIVEQIINDNLSWVPYTQLANLTGRPAMSVPLHWTAGGLPIGVQLVGRLGDDGLLLRLAAQLEQARPWADRRPPL